MGLKLGALLGVGFCPWRKGDGYRLLGTPFTGVHLQFQQYLVKIRKLLYPIHRDTHIGPLLGLSGWLSQQKLRGQTVFERVLTLGQDQYGQLNPPVILTAAVGT